MARSEKYNLALILARISLVAYVVSFFLPVLHGNDGDLIGFQAFYLSVISFEFAPDAFFPPPLLLWMANPILLVGAYFFYKGDKTAPAMFGGLATCFAISCLFGDAPLSAGYYAWLSSFVLFFIAAILRWRLREDGMSGTSSQID